MSIAFQVLGAPGGDNALFVRVQTGQTIHRLLFDCGEGCVAPLGLSEILAIDHLLFSHLHMDHVAGFDAFFRATFNRTSRPNQIWGPLETAAIMQCRFRGFMWNLYETLEARWHVGEILPGRITRTRFEANEAFAVAHDAGARDTGGAAIDHPDYTVHALPMDHHTPSLAYMVRERPRLNVDPEALRRLGLPPGQWLQQVKMRAGAATSVEIAGVRHDLAALRAELLVETPGDSLAYLTDFRLDGGAMARLSAALHGAGTLICESQYRSADAELARRNYHMTAPQAAELARRAGAQQLVLFHLSDRYRADEWREMLAEARAIFPNTRFPEHWQV